MTRPDDGQAPVPPRRRKYEERTRTRRIDAQERMNVILPAVVGFGFGGLVAWRYGFPFLVGAALGAVFVAVTVRVVLSGAARLIGGTLLNPSARSTPRRREYSAAESRVVRGDYEGAIAAYEEHVASDPGDPEPYLRIARLYRDQLERYDDAARWLQRAREGTRVDAGHELAVSQELIELYLNELRAPRQAIPELTLLCRKFPGTPSAAAAERELAELRAMLAAERDGDLSLTQQYLERRQRRGPEST